MWWLLAREVLQLRGKINRQIGFVLDDKLIMPDLYFYRDPQEQEKEEVETRDDRKDAVWATPLEGPKDEVCSSKPFLILKVILVSNNID